MHSWEAGILGKHQSGFHSEQSTRDILLQLERVITEALLHSHFCISLFFNLEKAYHMRNGSALAYCTVYATGVSQDPCTNVYQTSCKMANFTYNYIQPCRMATHKKMGYHRNLCWASPFCPGDEFYCTGSPSRCAVFCVCWWWCPTLPAVKWQGADKLLGTWDKEGQRDDKVKLSDAAESLFHYIGKPPESTKWK